MARQMLHTTKATPRIVVKGKISLIVKPSDTKPSSQASKGGNRQEPPNCASIHRDTEAPRYPVAVDVGGLDPGAVLHEHVGHGRGPAHRRPVQRRLLRVVRRVHVGPVLQAPDRIPSAKRGGSGARIARIEAPRNKRASRAAAMPGRRRDRNRIRRRPR